MASDNARKLAAERGQWLDQIAADNRMTAAAYRAAIMISHYYNSEEWKAWASADRMSQDYDIDRTGIIRGIQKLEELGHLRIDRKGGCNGSEYIWVLSGLKIVSKPKVWKTRHRSSNGAKSSTINGAKSSTINGAKSSTIQTAKSDAANGGRSDTVMVDGLKRNGAKSSTLTLDRTLEGTLEDGRALQGPLPRPSVDVELSGHPPSGDDSALPPTCSLSEIDEHDIADPDENGFYPVIDEPSAGSEPALASASSRYSAKDARELFKELLSRRKWNVDYTDCFRQYTAMIQTISPELILQLVDRTEYSDVYSLSVFLAYLEKDLADVAA